MDRKLFGVRLKELREKLGISQADLAERAEIGQGSVSSWEQGLRDPSWLNVVALADALGVSTEEFRRPLAGDVKPRGRGRPPKKGKGK